MREESRDTVNKFLDVIYTTMDDLFNAGNFDEADAILRDRTSRIEDLSIDEVLAYLITGSWARHILKDYAKFHKVACSQIRKSYSDNRANSLLYGLDPIKKW